MDSISQNMGFSGDNRSFNAFQNLSKPQSDNCPDTTLRLNLPDSSGSYGSNGTQNKRKFIDVDGTKNTDNDFSLVLSLGCSSRPSVNNKMNSATSGTMSLIKKSDEGSSIELCLNSQHCLRDHDGNGSHSLNTPTAFMEKPLEGPVCDLQLSLSSGPSASVITTGGSLLSIQNQNSLEMSVSVNGMPVVDEGSTSSRWKSGVSILPSPHTNQSLNSFTLGASINAGARDVAMLIIGRILLGIGVGFGNQSVPVYLSEMAPARMRGMLNIGFQLMVTIGILAANLINYGTDKIKAGWGWRVSLGLAAVPALIITIGSIFLPDTPNSLIDRGKSDQARTMLSRIRGTEDIHEEYADLVAASEESRLVQHPWRNIVQRKYRPQLTMAIMIPFFQQLTGINVIMFYAPVLFRTIGFGNNASLISAVITGVVNVVSTFLSILTVDKVGRRFLFLEGGVQMLICQIVVGTLIGVEFGTSGQGTMSKTFSSFVVTFICIYVAAFAWSWGPLGWLVPSEIFPLEIRSAGQSINVSVNMFFTFLIAQIFLTMLCHLKFGLFYFFGGWVVIMTLFIFFFLPETKNVPIEEVVTIWKSHWFWRKFVGDEATGNVNGNGTATEMVKTA